jgi:hypothetical protein
MINLSIPHRVLALRVSLALAAALPAFAAQATPAPDGSLFTTYSLGPGAQSVNWLVCGSTQQTEGCYDVGTLGKFGQVTAMIEGAPKVNATTGTVTREIYICDVAAGSGTGVTLYDYTKTDVVTATDDAVTVVLNKAVPLTLVGGANAACQMAANPADLYVEVNGGFVSVTKNGLVATGGPGAGVTSVTADHPGFVDVDYSNDTFYELGPNGSGVESGGGNYFEVGTVVGTSLLNVPMFNGTIPAVRMKVVPTSTGATSTATTAAAIDARLYTDYSVFSAGTIEFGICGATQQSEGCFGGGSYGPFNHPGSIIEGNRTYNGGTVTRHIYVCDDAAGSGTGVTLYDYKRSDVITSSYDTTTVTLLKTLPLPLVGGANANCTMAGDQAHLYVGTKNSKTAVKVNEANYSISATSGLDSSLPFAAVTANSYGFAATTFGSTSGSSDVNEFGPTGNPVQSTRGAYFLLNTANAVQTASLPTTAAALSASLLNVRLKQLTR